jgi:hypothetical protein
LDLKCRERVAASDSETEDADTNSEGEEPSSLLNDPRRAGGQQASAGRGDDGVFGFPQQRFSPSLAGSHLEGTHKPKAIKGRYVFSSPNVFIFRLQHFSVLTAEANLIDVFIFL